VNIQISNKFVGEIPERAHQGQEALQPALNVGLVEITIPDKLRSSKQKYRFTDKGQRMG
jgi:ATP-dependent DNA helicase RecG